MEITITENFKVVEFLDVELNLNTGTHKTYTKPNNIQFVNVKSDHTESMKKNIPVACQKRLSLLSTNEDIINSASLQYQEALDKAGYKCKYNATATLGASKKRYRCKQIMWFNPPFSHYVKTNLGAEFLKIVDSCFLPGNPLRVMCNKNTIKLSYKTTVNMAQVITRHNKQVSSQSKQPGAPAKSECNCQKAHLPKPAHTLGILVSLLGF